MKHNNHVYLDDLSMPITDQLALRCRFFEAAKIDYDPIDNTVWDGNKYEWVKAPDDEKILDLILWALTVGTGRSVEMYQHLDHICHAVYHPWNSEISIGQGVTFSMAAQDLYIALINKGYVYEVQHDR